jgi:hypothetical protein
MDILNKISAKQFIVFILVGGFILSKSDFFNDFIERFNFFKQLSNINIKPQIPTNMVDSEVDTDDESAIHRITQTAGNENDSFCNRKKDRLGDFEKQLICNVLKRPVSSDILQPINCIPYNFSKNYNNNVLYSINPRYTKNKLKYEKQVNNKVLTANQTPLKTNFDRDIDYYKITKRIDTIQNINPKLNINTYDILTRFKIQKSLKVFTRKNSEQTGIVTNWNIPILPANFFPKEVVVAINNSKKSYKQTNMALDKANVYMFKFKETSSIIEDAEGKFTIKSTNEGNRVIYTLFSDNKHWFLDSCNTHIAVIKIYFTFQFYDKNGFLQDCFIESNLSKLMY